MVNLDDESLPLWVRIEECMRLLDIALKRARARMGTIKKDVI